jgi:parvulin-like peptidyl-prolyl isomerase
MKPLLRLSWIGVVSVAALALTGCKSGGENLAVVNNEPITMQEFYDYLEVKPEVQVVLENGQIATVRVADTLAFQALQDLVRQRTILQLSKDMKLEPSATEVNQEVVFQRERDPQFIKNLLDRGLTKDQIEASLKVDLAREKLLTKDIKVTDEDVTKFIKDNPIQFTEPKQIEALWIFVKEEVKQRDVDRALNAGGSFATVATKYSDAPNAQENGGTFPQTIVDRLPAELQRLFDATAEGKETGWQRLTDGWAKFYVVKKTAAKKVDVNATERKWLKRQIAVQRGLQGSDLDKRLLDKLKDADITITFRELQGPWKAAMERLENASEEETKKATKVTGQTSSASPTTGDEKK